MGSFSFMASVTVSTHVFKTIDNLDLKVDVFLRTSITGIFDRKNPVVLFIHGGGFVGFNREHVPPHVVQSCLLRGWPLISADYRLLPQVKGADILEDVKDAYQFVRGKMPAILAGRESVREDEGPIENIIIVGQSAGVLLQTTPNFEFYLTARQEHTCHIWLVSISSPAHWQFSPTTASQQSMSSISANLHLARLNA